LALADVKVFEVVGGGEDVEEPQPVAPTRTRAKKAAPVISDRIRLADI
jgi:hypothetical protein